MSIEQLKNHTIVGESGAGLVKVTYNGMGELIKVEIDDLIFKETDKQLISDLFVAATRDAMTRFGEMLYDERKGMLNNIRLGR